MGELGRRQLEHTVQYEVLWSGRQPLFTTNDVRNTHQIIVNYICKVVRRIVVTLHDHLVVDAVVLKNHLAVH